MMNRIHFNWKELQEGYRYHVLEHVYKNVRQRWVMIFSKQAYEREIETLNRNIAKAETAAKKALWHLGNQIFRCEKDAEKALKIYQKT
jgi:transposase